MAADARPHAERAGVVGDDWPPVSVVIATRDRPGSLERAIAAVLEQDYPGHIECIVVFDNVPLRTIDHPVRPRRSVSVRPNRRRQGLPGGRNTGIDLACTDLLAFCDDDDAWHVDKLRRQVALLRDRPELAAVVSGIRVVTPSGRWDRPGPGRDLMLQDFLDSRVTEAHASTLLVPRRTARAVGPLDEQIPGGYAEDYDWLLRIAAIGPLGMVAEPLVTVEWHAGSFFSREWLTTAEALRYLLDKHPEFERSRRGRGRLHGQIAFMLASAGRRREALAHLLIAARLRPTDKHLLATLPVLLALVRGERVLALAQRRGRGI